MRKKCDGFKEDGTMISSYQQGENIIFRNNAGNEITFGIGSKQLTPKERQYCKSEEISYNCAITPCETTGELQAVSATKRGKSNTLDVKLTSSVSDYEEHYTFDARLLDIDIVGNYAPTFAVTTHGDDSVKADISFTANGKEYDNVLVYFVDTTSKYHLSRKIWRVYLTSQQGIIGFGDRETHSDYFLK